MRVKQITIENFGCIEHLEFVPGTVTVLRGPNASGKTSVIDAISSVFACDHSPHLIRKGAKKAVVTIQTDEITLRRTITPSGYELKVTGADGSIISKPETYVRTLASSFSFDPMEFIDAKPADRAKYLLAAMPISFVYDEVANACEDPNVKSAYNLEEFNRLRDGKYQARRDVNRDVKADEATLSTLDNLTTSDDETDWKQVSLDRQAQQREAELLLAENFTLIEKTAEQAQAAERRIRDEEIAELQKQIESVRSTCDSRVLEIIQRAADEKDARRREIQPLFDELIAKRTEAEQKAEVQLRARGARATVQRIDDALQEKRRQAIQLDRVVQALDDLKTKKLGELPIQGVEIRDGEIYMDGLPYSRLNLQKQVFLAFEFGSLKMGGLPLVVADNFEHIDSRNFEEFVQAIRGTGWQVVVAQVSTESDRLEVQAVA